ncbi:MAG: HNH endonuclease [Defluviitaleaceae bacterium]|nr:HNH endonuclease [Defluviitaleaceae bacterium]
MGFLKKVKEDVLVACSRHCAICKEFQGPHIELHHIVPESEGGEHTFDNCIPLCYKCHGEVKAYNEKHPKGNKYSESELRRHKNACYDKYSNKVQVTQAGNNYALGTIAAISGSLDITLGFQPMTVEIFYCGKIAFAFRNAPYRNGDDVVLEITNSGFRINGLSVYLAGMYPKTGVQGHEHMRFRAMTY